MSTSEATTVSATTIKKSERKGSVMIEAALNIPDEKISEVQVKKDGVIVQTKEEQSHSKISIKRKVSTASEKETVVQLEIENAKPEDEGSYEIVAKDQMGEVKAKKVSITKKQIHQVAVAEVEKIDIPDGASVQMEEESQMKVDAEVQERKMSRTEQVAIKEEEESQEAVTVVQERKMSRTEQVAIKEEEESQEAVTEVQERKMSRAEEVSGKEEKPQEAEASPFGVKKLRKVSRTEELKEGTPATGSSKEQTPEAEASPFGLKKLRKVSRQEDTKESTPTKDTQEPEKPKLRKTSKADSEQSQTSQKDAPAEDAAEALATSGVTEVKKKKKKVVKKKKKKEEPLEPPEFSSFLKTQVRGKSAISIISNHLKL